MADKSEETLEHGISRQIEKDRRKYNLGICLFSLLNVLLITLIAVTAFYVFSEKVVIVSNDADICVHCEDLKLHPDDKTDGVERRGENKTMCCVEKVEQDLNAVIGYYTDHWLKKRLADDNRQFTRYKCEEKDSTKPLKPNIKLVGINEKQSAEHHKVHWDVNTDLAIVPDDESITHHKEHGLIEIKKSGLYQVYSQVVLDHNIHAHNHNNAPDIYQHSVILIEAEMSQTHKLQEVILMKTSNSYCESKTNRQTITSYLGGAFQLAAGDKLAVKAHNKTELVDVAHMNFFGAHML